MRDSDPPGALRVVLAVALLWQRAAGSSIFIPSSSAPSCSAANEFYDASVLGCNSCDRPSGGATAPNSLLTPNENDLNALGMFASCTCRSSAYWKSEDDTFCASSWPAPCNLDLCTSCPTGLVPSSDQLRCLPCGRSTLGVDASKSNCKCATNSIVVEKNEAGVYLPAKECVACTNGTHGDPVTNQCTQCNDPAMTLAVDPRSGEHECVCRTGYKLVTSTWLAVSKCVAQSRTTILSSKINVNLAATVKFADFNIDETVDSSLVVTFSSDLVQDIFPLAASECYFYQNEKQSQFCQALGNLCVLQHLSPTAAPCALFELIQKSGRATSANDINGWFYTLPFLKYATNARSVLESDRIGMKMSFDEVSNIETHDRLEFVLASYTIDGTLKSFQRLTNQLLYCLDASVSATASSTSAIPLWTRFGVSTSSHFTCDLSTLDASNMELHEIFLIDKSKPEGTNGRYVPVPVKNLNYADERGLYINRNVRSSDAQDDFLSNRFFLFDVASGVQVGESKTRVYRYADSIKLTIRTQSTDPSSILPPVLTISYADTQTPVQTAIQFQVVYASDTSNFWSAATTIFSIAGITAGIRVILHIFTWQRRNTRHEEMALTAWHSILHLITSLVSNYARACFFVMFILSGYFLVFFKLQSAVFLLLPETNAQLRRARKDEYYPFRVMLQVAFTFQLVTVLHRVYQQTRAHLFLIDWEKPRAKVIDMDSSQVQPAPVSIWRTILVANEWNKLQTARRTPLGFTLVVMLFLLYGCDLRSLALPIPRSQMVHMTTKATTASTLTTDEDLSTNVYLRFGTVTALWLLICLIQRMWKWLIYERFFDEPREQLFVDLCTVAKVSCFIVDETYHGFYLHCRSPYPFADGTMKEIVEQLKQETAGLTVGRGLDTSMPGCQTFEMFFTRRWKRKYLTLFNAVHDPNATRRNNDDPDGPSGPRKQTAPMRIGGAANRGRMSMTPHSTTSLIRGWHSPGMQTTQSMIEHTTELSDFLKSFIENQDDQFRWRIYRMETCLTRFFGIPPEMSATRQSYFLPDTDSRFTRVVYLGMENDLMLMNLLCFTAFDLWFDNHAISALATYLIEAFLVGLRSHFGTKSVSQTSLVDPRFLMK